MRFNPLNIVSCLDLIPSQTRRQFIVEVSKWLRSNGASWSMERLKDLRQRAIAVRSSSKVTMTQWFKLTSSKKLSGNLAFIDKIGATGSDREFRDLIQLLSVFTAFKLPEDASPQDHLKQYKAMQHTTEVDSYPTIPSSLLYRSSSLRKPDEYILNRVFERQGSFWDVATRSINRGKLAIVTPPSLIEDFGVDSKDVHFGFHLLIKHSIWSRRNVPPRVIHKESPFLRGSYGLEIPRTSQMPKGVGHIRYRVQPNGKVRYYASPYPVVQKLLKPLGDLVYDLLRDCEWDCTFDQSAGVTKVQQWLREGKSCSSIDLTSATDVFPLKFQTDCIFRLCSLFAGDSHIFLSALKEQLSLFTYISREEWLLPPDMCDAISVPTGSTGRWKTGQPLGTYPSFGMFALSHAMLVLRACCECGVPAEEAPKAFVILGDDIVINNDLVASRYLALLDTLRVGVSHHKCVMNSTKLAEFAGKIITKELSFFKPKYLPVTDKTAVSLVDTFGPKVIGCYNLFQRGLVSLPHPLGRDLNPEGYSLTNRYMWLAQLKSDDKDKRRVIGPCDALRRKVEIDSVSDRPDLNVYKELPELTVLGFKPGADDSVFFLRNHELRRLWSRLPAYVNPKSVHRYSYYTASSFITKARQVIPC